MADKVVMRSIEAPGGFVCVDIIRWRDGLWSFESYRRDPEDGRGWGSPGGFLERSFPDEDAAVAAALESVPWLGDAL